MGMRLSCICGYQWDGEDAAACPVCKAVATEPDQPATVALKPPTDGVDLTIESRPGRQDAPTGRGVRLPVLAGFEMVGELGRGGMGVVYRARQTKLHRVVALKMILGGGHASDADLQRFLGEASAVAQLQHPNIVQLFETGQHEGLPYFTLEFVEGGSLAAKLGGAPLPPGEAARLVEALARGVHYAHEQGVVHRDLKPANVLLARDGTPKVTDFGLAKQVSGSSGLTQSGTIMGTPSYMAPEQARGQGHAVGPPADVYALGAILYECLTGRPPFRAATPMETIYQVVTDEVVPPAQLQSKVPHDIQTICLKCLAKEPANRYPSAAALADDLGRFLRDEPVLARPAGVLERLGKWARRRPAAAALLAVSAAATLALTAGWAYFSIHLAERNRLLDDAEKEARQSASDEKQARQRAEKAEADALRLAQAEKAARAQSDLATTAALFQACRADSARHALQLDVALRAWQRHDVAEAERVLGAVAAPLQQTWESDFVRGLCQRKAQALSGHTGPILAVAFSGDRRRIASASIDTTVRLWNADTGACISILKGHQQPVTGVALSRDGTLVASASYDGAVKLWDATGKELHTLKGHTDKVTSIAVSADGLTIVSGSADQTVRVWDAKGNAVHVLTGHGDLVRCVALSASGRRIVSGSGDKTVKVWDALKGELIRTLKGHTREVHAVALSGDGRHLASGSDDRTVKLWDADKGTELRTLLGHTQTVSSVAISADGRRIASACSDQTVRVWEATGLEAFALQGHLKATGCVALSADGQRILSGGSDMIVRVWDPMADAPLLTLPGKSVVQAVAVSTSKNRLRVAAGSSDKLGRVWNGVTGEHLISLDAHKSTITSVAFSPDGARIASGSADRTIRLWDAATGGALRSLEGHTGSILSVMFSADGERIVSGGMDNCVKIWDAAAAKELHHLPGHTGGIRSVAIAADGLTIASASVDQSIKLWNADTGKELRTLTGHTGAVNSVAISGDGARIVSGGADKTIRIWDARAGTELLVLNGHAGAVTSVALSSDGSRIFSGSLDKTVKVWDAATGQDKLTLVGHTKVVLSVAHHQGHLVSAGADGSVRVWAAAPQRN